MRWSKQRSTFPAQHRWYHHKWGMKPQTIGRVLGIGVRVAGRMAGQRLAGSAQAPAGNPPGRTATGPLTIDAVNGPAAGRAAGRAAGQATGSVARGVGGFLKPFRRVGNILFLEVVGVFFFVFVLIFGQMIWRARASYLHGPDHQKFLVAAAMALIFLYLSVSSFWRARKK
jgi:hypothetical protein